MKIKERIDELDVLRAYAFLAVVMQHTLGVYIRQTDIGLPEDTLLGMLFNVVKFAVPTFVFITGLTLFYNYSDGVQYPKFLKKRILEILIPYLVWTFVYELYFDKGILPLTAGWAREFTINIILGRESYHLWYIPMIFQFYILFPAFVWIYKLIQSKITSSLVKRVILLLFGVFYTWLMWFTASYIGAGHLHVQGWFLTSMVRFLDRDFLFWSAYFVMGAIAGISLLKWRKWVVSSVPWNSLALLLGFLWVGYELMRSVYMGHVNLNYSTSLKPSMFLYTVSEILVVYGLAVTVTAQKSKITSFLQWIGKYSYGAYLAHALVLNYSVRLTAKLIHGTGHYLEKTLLAFAICAVAATILTYLLSRVPGIGRYFVGSSGKKKVVVSS